jgi:hypothetical protein
MAEAGPAIIKSALAARHGHKEVRMSEVEQKKGFSWMGLLFGGAYYAGYGKVAKGLIMAVISFIPLTAIPVNIYAALKAKKQLPVGSQPFNWGMAILAFCIPAVLSAGILFLAQGGMARAYTEADFRSDASGYWRVQSSGEQVGFDLRQRPYASIVNGSRYPLEMVRFIPKDEDGYCSMVLSLTTGDLLSLGFAPESDSKTMSLSRTGAPVEILLFMRKL